MKNRTITLHSLINRMMTTSMPVAVRNKSFIINDVPATLTVDVDQNMVSSVFGFMLNTIASCATDTCIRITAKTYGKIVLVHLKDSNSSNSFALSSGLQQVQPLAEKIGGHIGISSKIKKLTTVAFAFPNIPAAA